MHVSTCRLQSNRPFFNYASVPLKLRLYAKFSYICFAFYVEPQLQVLVHAWELKRISNWLSCVRTSPVPPPSPQKKLI